MKSLDLTSLKSTISQLEDVLILCNHESYKNDPRMRKHLLASTIKAFEYTYAISLKMIKRYAEMTTIEPNEIHDMSFSSIIRYAFGKELVMSDITVWRNYRKQRGITSHTYNEEKAQAIFEIIPDFLKEAQYVLARLEERNSSLD